MLAVLTYDNSHKKTYDVLTQLKARGFEDVTVLGTPWEEKASFKPLIRHRPLHSVNIHPADLCRNLGYYYEVCPLNDMTNRLDDLKPEYVLIGGAGILPEEMLNRHVFLNSHPGYMPVMRGLDSLKWAIYEGKPIGVTSHIATAEADAGPVIDRVELMVQHWDTFHSFAFRQYDTEIRMLVDAVELLRSGRIPEPIDVTGTDVHRRMPHAFEMRLLQRFQALVDKSDIT